MWEQRYGDDDVALAGFRLMDENKPDTLRKDEEQMHSANGRRVVMAGFAATIVMSLLAFFFPSMGSLRMNSAGMILNFALGTILFPLAYGYLVYASLPGAPWLRGFCWGLILWFLMQVVVMPAAGY